MIETYNELENFISGKKRGFERIEPVENWELRAGNRQVCFKQR